MKRKTRNKIIVWTLALAAVAILVGGTIALVLTAGTLRRVDLRQGIRRRHERYNLALPVLP
ncbi:Chitinase-like protein 1 [Zea mays]|uniref:Chitinase-like protein 1 n=1 Tax=Zea mays TaxID=4577 RepID=A0A1D6I7F8_MAIZE|nr:Chitinase-like protein 1 [Zea mays]